MDGAQTDINREGTEDGCMKTVIIVAVVVVAVVAIVAVVIKKIRH